MKRENLALEHLNEGVGLDREASDPDVTSPGLALAGYTARTPDGRMWVFGETEITYMETISDEEAEARLDVLFSYNVPAVFVSKAQEVPRYFLDAATRHGVPVLRSPRTTKDLYQLIKPFLELSLAPTTTLHGERVWRRAALHGPEWRRKERVCAGSDRAGTSARCRRPRMREEGRERRPDRTGP